MPLREFIRKPILLLFFIILIPASISITECAAEEKARNTYETLYADIHYDRGEDIRDFGVKIGRGELLLARDGDKALGLVKENLDGIVYRVRVLLDMYPPQFRFGIRIYPAYADIKDAFRERGVIGKAPIAFYSHKTRTIYVSLENLNDRILAHEVAHAVINAYFSVPPPGQMQEILAQYVDKHLWD